jgi:dihydrofolate reductase
VIAIIVAMDRQRVIGAGNRLPWHLPDDLRRFRTITRGHPVIMGRKTFESIGRPLAGRTNVVVTRQRGYRPPGCVVVHSLEGALAAVPPEETFVIGGASIYRQALPLVDRLYVTEVDTRVDGGDAYFPEIDPGQWHLTETADHPADARHQFPFRYLTYDRVAPAAP